MEPNQVQWNRLPHDPVGFFGLSPQFERSDLKRSYGKMIRIYKPETHPQEFQRIREAYEELESRNRYGVQQQLSAKQIDAWSFNSSVSESKKPSRSESMGSVESSAPVSNKVLATQDPFGAYQKLSTAANKTPQDFYILAMLSDMVDRADPQRFLKWLLTGIKQFPDDPGLNRLLREYLASDVETEAAQSVLVTLSKIVPAEVFYQVTEPLWDRVARSVPFDTFAKVLAACESNFKQGAIVSRIVFYVHLLRVIRWRATDEWYEQKWMFIQQHGTEIPDHLEQDMEFLTLVRDYFRLDRSKVAEDSMRRQIDEMIRSYCEDPWNISTAKVAQVQDDIARNGNGVMDSFAATDIDADNRVLLLNAMIAFDVIEQTGLGFEEAPIQRLAKQSDLVIADLRNESGQIWNRLTWMRWRLFSIPYSLLVFVPIVMVFGWFSKEVMFMFTLGWLVLGTLAHFAVVKQFFLDPRASKKTQDLVNRAYSDHWRPRLFRYVQSCHASPREAITMLQESAEHVGDSQLLNIILSYASGDLGLRSFHLAQQFVH